MKFFDEVNITVKSGAGGDGLVSGRREKHVPFGGPAGGNGGQGGSVILKCTSNEWTLMKYRYNVMYKAKPGERGGAKEQYGKDAEDITLLLPVGTRVKSTETGTLLGLLNKEGDEIVIARGGKGGIGNIQFVTPQIQYPEMALFGEPGHTKKITLELQLLADIALVGLPSVGKSSLINAISNVKAKTAEYHFTTLIPNLGVVGHKGKSFTVIDIPGLIEGASDGKGLGSEFLRHILKSRVLCFMIDAEKYEAGWPDFEILFTELTQYIQTKYPGSIFTVKENDGEISLEVTDAEGEIIMRKAMYWIISKQDAIGDAEIEKELLSGWIAYLTTLLKKSSKKITAKVLTKQTFVLSSATREGVDTRLDRMMGAIDGEDLTSIAQYETAVIEKEIEHYVKDITEVELEMLIEKQYLAESNETRKKKVREVSDEQISYLSYVIPRGNDQAEMRYRRQMDQYGHLAWFKDAGGKRGDILKIVSCYEGVKDQYISWE